MKIVSDLYKKIKDPAFNRKQFTEGKDKKKVLFLDPIMTNFDWYTCLIPYFAMDESETCSTAITGLYRFSELDTKPQTVLTHYQILWADYIVVPFTLEKHYGEGELFSALRSLNPRIKIIFTVEFDFYEIGKEHYLLKEHPDDGDVIIKRFEGNCRGADRLIVMNEKLATKMKSRGFKDVKTLPIFYDEETLKENINFEESLGIRHTPKIFYLSCDLNEYNNSSFKEYIPVFKKIQDKHKTNFRLVIIGEDPKKYYPNFSLDYIHLSKGSIIHKYKNIVKSTADCHLVLNKKTEYYINSESINDYVERGVFSIPIVTSSIYPYNELIADGKNGFILKSRMGLIKIIDTHIKKKDKLQEICSTVRKDLAQHHEIDEGKVKFLEQLFTENYIDLEELE